MLNKIKMLLATALVACGCATTPTGSNASLLTVRSQPSEAIIYVSEKSSGPWEELRNEKGLHVTPSEVYLKKGDQAYFEGGLQSRSFEDSNGNTRYVTEVKARDVILLGSPHGGVGIGSANGYSDDDTEESDASSEEVKAA